MNTAFTSSSTRRGAALLAALMLLIVAFSLTINMIDLGSANVRSQALRESDVRSYADAMSAANYSMDYLVTNATATAMPANPTSITLVDLASLTCNGASHTASPFSDDTTHKVGFTWDKVPTINSSKLAWARVTPMTAGQPYYLIKVDSEGYTTNSKTIALGSDVDQSMLRGVDSVVKVTVPSSLSTQTGIAMAVNANATYSYKASVDWWNSGWNGTNKGSAFSSSATKYSTALVQAFAAIPTPFGNGGSVNSNPEFAKSSVSVPTFTYASPSASWGNITSGGTALPSAAVDSSGNLTGSVTLIAGQSYHFASISSSAVITIDNGGNLAVGTAGTAAPTAEVYVDGQMNLSSPLVYTQNNTVLELYQGDPGSSFSYNGNTAFGATQYSPGRFIWATSAAENITMNGNGSFGGVLIAPNATVKLNGTFNFYGALEVGTISQISGNFSLAYDSELSSQQYTLPAVVSATNITMTMNMWRTR